MGAGCTVLCCSGAAAALGSTGSIFHAHSCSLLGIFTPLSAFVTQISCSGVDVAFFLLSYSTSLFGSMPLSEHGVCRIIFFAGSSMGISLRASLCCSGHLHTPGTEPLPLPREVLRGPFAAGVQDGVTASGRSGPQERPCCPGVAGRRGTASFPRKGCGRAGCRCAAGGQLAGDGARGVGGHHPRGGGE